MAVLWVYIPSGQNWPRICAVFHALWGKKSQTILGWAMTEFKLSL